MGGSQREKFLATAVAGFHKIARPLMGAPVIAILVVIVCLGACAFAWSRLGSSVTNDDGYQIAAKRIQIPEQPAWIHSDVREDVVTESSLSGMSLLDPEVTLKVRRAFELHTWVSKVHFVSKRAGGTVLVDLTYRQPAVMVETEGGWWPVDTEGVLLPPDEFSLNQTRNYLNVRTHNHMPQGLVVGTSFGDPGVLGAARLATALETTWRQMGLVRIHVIQSRPVSRSQDVEIVYELESSGGTRIQWGRAPGQERPGEQTAIEKSSGFASSPRKRGRSMTLARPIRLTSASDSQFAEFAGPTAQPPSAAMKIKWCR